MSIEVPINPHLHMIDSKSWRIAPEVDRARRDKEQLTDIQSSFYWLSFGLNPALLYQQGVRKPYTQEIYEPRVQSEYIRRLQTAGTSLPNLFHATYADDKSIVVTGPYTHEKRGRAAIILKRDDACLIATHTWLPQE